MASARIVRVDPERLSRWSVGFEERHGPVTEHSGDEAVVLTGADGATAALQVPFPPLTAAGVDALVAHAVLERRVGILLVRLGGHAAGVALGPRLMETKVGSRPVHGRSAAGGQSQQRFARRREGQVRVALAAAADNAVRVLIPVVAELDAVVLGGDRRALDIVLSDARLAPLRPLVSGPVLDVPDPRQRVLQAAPALLRAVVIRLTD